MFLFVGCFSILSEKYSELINKKIYPLKQCLVELESNEALPPHPKLATLVRMVGDWKKVKRKSCRDKVEHVDPFTIANVL